MSENAYSLTSGQSNTVKNDFNV